MKEEMAGLIRALSDGDCAESVAGAKRLAQNGVGVERIVIEGVEAALTQLDAKCTLEEFNLLEIMLVGRAVMEVMKMFYPAGTPRAVTKGVVVIASLEGDVHDLGKNILKMVLTGKGYRVIDCGKDCPASKLVKTAAAEIPLAIGVSGLITTIIPSVKQLKELLKQHQLENVKVIAGGASLKQFTPESLNVDFVAQSAFDGAAYLDQIVGVARQ